MQQEGEEESHRDPYRVKKRLENELFLPMYVERGENGMFRVFE